MSIVRKASFTVSATERAPWETLLEERLTEDGFIVASCEISRDGPWRIDVFGEGDPGQVDAAIAAGAQALGIAAPHWVWEDLPDIDWVAENQRSFRPFTVGPFWVHPSHVSEGQSASSIPLRIDAGLAFGTGTHATTRGCLELLATLDPANAIDVGCGSGILTIAMAKLWRRRIRGGDNDAEAVDVARENAALNGVGNLCHFVTAAGLENGEIAAAAPFDLIVANILAGPLVVLAESFAKATRPGGRILLSGLLVEQAGFILAEYRPRGFTVERRVDLETGGAWWRTLLLRKS